MVVAQEVGDLGARPRRDEERSLRGYWNRVPAEGVGVLDGVEAHCGGVRVDWGDELLSSWL